MAAPTLAVFSGNTVNRAGVSPLEESKRNKIFTPANVKTYVDKIAQWKELMRVSRTESVFP